MMKRTTFHRAEAHLALNQRARGLALGLALLLVIFSLAGCARRNAVSLRIVSAYSGKGVANATLTFTSSSGSETLSSDATGTVRDRFRPIGHKWVSKLPGIRRPSCR